MKDERFLLTASDNLMWTLTDSESGFSIEFREGLFNETQQVHQPASLPADANLAKWTAEAMRAAGDYMAKQHPDIALCNAPARRSALWMLSNEKYWITMAAACRSLLVNFSDNQSGYLYQEVEDYLNLSGENAADLSDAEKVNLLGALSMLGDDEADEVLTILCAFWNEHYEAQADTSVWARDLLWWPAWVNDIVDNIEIEEYGKNQ